MATQYTDYEDTVALTVTSLHSLASAQDWTAGWTSDDVFPVGDTWQDILISGTFTTHASNRQAGFINVYVYAALSYVASGPTVVWPDIFSAGTEGAEGTCTFTDSEQRDSAARLLVSIPVDTGASEVYTFPPTGIAALFGGRLPPVVALFVGQNASTTTTAGLAAAGSAIYYTPVFDTSA